MIERRKPLKRTALKRPTLDQVRAFSNKPRKAIAKIGAKTKRERPALDHFREVLRKRTHGMCEIPLITGRWREVCDVGAIAHFGQDPHHVWPEDRDRGVHDPARGLWCCRTGHNWIDNHPREAQAAGLLRPHGDAVAL